MVMCDYCGLPMGEGFGCTEAPIMIEGRLYRPISYGREPGMKWTRRSCHDCGVSPGEVHHHGCDMERCPRCQGQSISCGCRWAGEKNPDEEWAEGTEQPFLFEGPVE